jgi:hypothetical protein
MNLTDRELGPIAYFCEYVYVILDLAVIGHIFISSKVKYV